jgi:hypothetical protein
MILEINKTAPQAYLGNSPSKLGRLRKPTRLSF